MSAAEEIEAPVTRRPGPRQLQDGVAEAWAQEAIDAYVVANRDRPMAFHLDAGRAAEAGALMRFLRSQGFSSVVSLTNQPAGLIVTAIPRGSQ